MQEKRAASVVGGWKFTVEVGWGFLWMYTPDWGPGPLQMLVEMIDFSGKLPALAHFSILTNPHIYW